MPTLADITTLIPVAVFVLAALVAALVLARRGAQSKADRRILADYGRVPEVRRDDLSHLKPYHEAFAEAHPNARRLDGTTWNDLGMDEVFLRLNVCSSSVGEEYLCHMLHELRENRGDLDGFERLVRWLDAHEPERLRLTKLLGGVGKRRHNGLSAYLFHAGAKRLKHPWLYAALAALPLSGLALVPLLPGAGISLTLVSVFVNILVYYRSRLALEKEFDAMRYFSALVYGAKAIDGRLGEELRALGIDLKAPLKPFVKTHGLVPGNVRNGMAELESLVIIAKSVFLVDLMLYNHTVGLMLRHARALNALFETVGKLDAALSVASFRRSLPRFCEPEFREGGGIGFSGMYHPLLANPVPNSARIGNDSIVTGSNASGKSTFIKAVAVNCILAQTIGTCCAESFSLDFFYVATSMALRDDILAGESYFVAEVKSLRRILEYCRAQRCAVFVDEILRGTNTPERIASSVAVLRTLHETGSLCLVASHDVELTSILAGVYDNYHFSEKFEGGEITFDYLLKEGPSRSANAIRLLESLGFEQRIVEEARAFLETAEHKM